MVKVEEGGGDSRGEWIHQAITTFFETDWKLWGNDTSSKLLNRNKKSRVEWLN